MEYVFGTSGEIETLKTKGVEHTNLSGYQQISREFKDSKITDRFRVVKKICSKEDPVGDCYDWYEIDRHYRETDNTKMIKEAAAKNAANIDYLSMMSYIDLPGEDGGDVQQEV